MVKQISRGDKKAMNRSFRNPTNIPIKLWSLATSIIISFSSVAVLGGAANATEEMTPVIYFDANVLASDLIHSERGQRLEQYQLALDPVPLSRVMKTNRVGYSFGGWSYKVGDVAATTLQTSTYTAARLDLYAVWNTKINLDGNGATKGLLSSIDYRFAQDLTLPGAGSFKRKGYTFGGWMATSAPGPVLTSYRAGVMDNGNPTFYASWTRTVKFKSGGGTGSVPASITYTAGGDRLVLPSGTSLTKSGFEFAGWSTTPRGKAVTKTSSFMPKKANTVLYAVWKKN
jgi:uncharacterized repeat protein (TIGR02543 family)